MRFLETDAHDDHAEEGHGDEETEKDLLTIKIIVLVFMFVAGAFVFFPYASFVKEDETLPEEQRKKKTCCKGKFFSMMNCFAAGMLLSMAICHILPEADAMFGKALAASAALEAEAIEVTPEAEEDDHDHDDDGEEDHGEEDHDEEDEDHDEEDEDHDEEEDHDDEDHEEGEHDDHAEEGHDDHAGHAGEAEHGFPLAHAVFFGGFMMMLLFDKVIFGKAGIKVDDKSITRDSIKEAEMQIQNASDTEKEGGESKSGSTAVVPQILSSQDQAQGDVTTIESSDRKMLNSDKNKSSSVKELQRISTQSLIGFGLAICLHSLIDGLAIGIFSEIGTITVLAVSVVIHKIPVACTVGTTFKSQSQELMAPTTMVVFVAFILATPIGMIIGMSIQESDETLLVLPIIQALSGGTFVYLACCDLLIHEFHHNKGQSKLLAAIKMGVMCFGAAIVITLIGVAPAHDH